ncbi:uncharacterized protein LOC134576879 [Pelobates fuscus]|uniref:uncharacterized protein LOC134576879 n=1 Tax=Pelobates fuscus TaxID=191477 RepID=UPI002FE4AD28
MTCSENVKQWLMNYIKRHGGPYEISQDCKQSWEKMQEFLGGVLFEKNVSDKKRKGCIMQALLSCCLKLEGIVKIKEDEIAELNSAINMKSEKLNNKIVDLRVHAVTTGEALIEKAKMCEELTVDNERLNEKILEMQKDLDECRHATNMAFNKMAESMAPSSRSPVSEIPGSIANPGIGDTGYKPLFPWEDLKQKSVTNLPAAPTTTTTVLNPDNSGEIQLVTKQLKPQEMDAIVREIGQVPQQDINHFLQWFCGIQRVKEMYSLTTSDMERVLQRVVGNGLWVRIVQTCGQQRRTRDMLKEILRALYGVTSNVSLSGKIKQLKQESPYELSARISTVMEQFGVTNPGFEQGGMVHRSMFLDALEEDIKDEILSVTPNPSEMCDLLLRADNLWRRKVKNESFAVDAARIFRVERRDRSTMYPQKPIRGNRFQHMGNFRGENESGSDKRRRDPQRDHRNRDSAEGSNVMGDNWRNRWEEPQIIGDGVDPWKSSPHKEYEVQENSSRDVVVMCWKYPGGSDLHKSTSIFCANATKDVRIKMLLERNFTFSQDGVVTCSPHQTGLRNTVDPAINIRMINSQDCPTTTQWPEHGLFLQPTQTVAYTDVSYLPDEAKLALLYRYVTELQMHSRSHSKSCKKGNRVCRFGFPKPPIRKTRVTYPLPEEQGDCAMKPQAAKNKLKPVWDLLNNRNVQLEDMSQLLAQCDMTLNQYNSYIEALTCSSVIVMKHDVKDIIRKK